MVESVQSHQPSIVKEILASADLQACTSTSTASLQQPKLTQDFLTEKQKEIFDNLMNYYPELVVLIALEKFGENQFEAENWILENASQYDMPEVEGAGTDTDIDEDMRSDSELESDPDMASAATLHQSPMGMYSNTVLHWACMGAKYSLCLVTTFLSSSLCSCQCFSQTT